MNITKERLKYLESELKEDQNKLLFLRSKKLFLKFNKCIRGIESPLIGLDNDGNIVCEWRNYHSHKFISISFNGYDLSVHLVSFYKEQSYVSVTATYKAIANIFKQI